MTERFIYTVYLDDSSKLAGYSAQVFEGVQAALDTDSGVLTIAQGKNQSCRINWSRVRWYTSAPVEPEPVAVTA